MNGKSRALALRVLYIILFN